jgi:hypothetical protein
MSWFQRKTPSDSTRHARRSALFADAALATAAMLDSDDPDTPSARFHAALASLQVGDRSKARTHLLSLLDLAAADTPLSLQVWSCLRELGETAPPGLAQQVRGVVVEFGVGIDGTDTVAIYDDASARVIDHRGRERTWSEPDCEIDDRVETLLTAARRLVERTPTGSRGDAPVGNNAAISVLTCGGVHGVRGDLALLERDPLCNPVLKTARALLADLMTRGQHASQGN